MTKIKIDNHIIELTNLDKVLFPEDNLTKADLIHYYHKIASTMVPHIAGRPLTMQRYPNGIDSQWFYQKDTPAYFPDWIERVAIEKSEGGFTNYMLCANEAALVYLANTACISIHSG